MQTGEQPCHADVPSDESGSSSKAESSVKEPLQYLAESVAKLTLLIDKQQDTILAVLAQNAALLQALCESSDEEEVEDTPSAYLDGTSR